jgi:CRISPR/Cas system-associated endoribonuclease Cas2
MSAIKGKPEFDFKEQNPIITTCSWFNKVYKDNKPDIASKICWAMYMIEEADDDDNPYARIIDREERINEVQKSYYKVDINSEIYKGLVSDYTKFILSKEEALFNIHITKFEELTAYLKDLDPSDDSQYKKYINIMDKLHNFWKGLQTVKDNMIEAKNKNKIRGNAQLSMREKRRK